MAFDQYLADRITQVLVDRTPNFLSKNMMGGHIFMVDDKMCCGIHIDKYYGDSLLMARIGEDAYETEIKKDVCLPMDFTGRPMKGYIFVVPEGFDEDEDLEYWIDLALEFLPSVKVRPKGKISKKKKP